MAVEMSPPVNLLPVSHGSVHSQQQGALLLWPLLLLGLAFIICYGLGGDFWLASWIYQLEGGRWALQQHWLTEDWLHRGVRTINQWLVVVVLLSYLLRLWWERDLRALQAAPGAGGLSQPKPSQTNPSQTNSNQMNPSQTKRVSRALLSLNAHGQLLASVLLSLAGVAALKQLLPIDCPWDLLSYGGSQQFVGLFSPWPANRAPNACFPAGHASVGYAWLGLYFYCRQLLPRLALPALMLSSVLGLVLGINQQLRGAHFISHDIATAAWCWSMACLTAYWPTLQRRRFGLKQQLVAALTALRVSPAAVDSAAGQYVPAGQRASATMSATKPTPNSTTKPTPRTLP